MAVLSPKDTCATFNYRLSATGWYARLLSVMC